MAIKEIGLIAQLFNTIAKLWGSRPSRLKAQALEAARRYIEINERGLVNGKTASDKIQRRWMIHYRKQFISWMDGV